MRRCRARLAAHLEPFHPRQLLLHQLQLLFAGGMRARDSCCPLGLRRRQLSCRLQVPIVNPRRETQGETIGPGAPIFVRAFGAMRITGHTRPLRAPPASAPRQQQHAAPPLASLLHLPRTHTPTCSGMPELPATERQAAGPCQRTQFASQARLELACACETRPRPSTLNSRPRLARLTGLAPRRSRERRKQHGGAAAAWRTGGIAHLPRAASASATACRFASLVSASCVLSASNSRRSSSMSLSDCTALA